MASVFWKRNVAVGAGLITSDSATHFLVPPVPRLVSSLCHVFARGNPEELLSEASGVASGVSLLSSTGGLPEIEDAIYHYFRECLKTPSYYTPYEELAAAKQPKTSCGYPWKNTYSAWENFLEEFTDEETEIVDYSAIAELCEELVQLIIANRAYQSIFYVFGKTDKYSFKKIASGQYRTIQVGDFFHYLIFMHFWGDLIHNIELYVPQFYLITDHGQYQKKCLDRLPHFGRQIGIDYTKYDKSLTQDLVVSSFDMLQRLEPIPEQVYLWLRSAVAGPLILMQDEEGTLLCTGGSNPSGFAGTSYTNSYGHLVHNCKLAKELYGCFYRTYLEDRGPFRSLMTGDDGREAFASLEYATAAIKFFPELLYRWFGITARIDGIVNEEGALEPYPFGVMAPYLGLVEFVWPQDDEGTYNLIRYPQQFSRQMCSSFYYTSDIVSNPERLEKCRFERLTGIINSSAGFYYILHCMPDLISFVPDHWLDLASYAESIGVPVPDVSRVAEDHKYTFDSSLSKPTKENLRYQILESG